MTAKPTLKRNAIFNFLGSVLPIFVSLVSTPVYLHHIGAERFGVLAILWMLQGYFGFFDLGLSFAASNRIAQLSDATPAERESVFWTALLLNLGFGLVGALLLFALMHVMLAQFDIGPVLSAELRPAQAWICALVPLTNVIAACNGAMSGREQFGIANAVQFVVVMLFQLSPLCVAIVFGPNLHYLVFATLFASVISLIITFCTMAHVFPLRLAAGPDRKHVRPLFSYGAWISITGFATPVLETADRLLIGHVLGPQAVTYYQVPFSLAARARLVPSVITRTLFPRLSALGGHDAAQLSLLALRGLTLVMTPAIVFGIFLMRPFLSLWVGHDFANSASSVGETILLGVWINCLAVVLSCHLQAEGRPGVVARFQLVEIVLFIASLWWALHAFGVLGAALAWSARCALDGALLFWAAHFGRQHLRQLIVPALLILAAYGSSFVLDSLSLAGVAAWVGLTCTAIAWSISAEPRACAKIVPVLASFFERNRERIWKRKSAQVARNEISLKRTTRECAQQPMSSEAMPETAACGDTSLRSNASSVTKTCIGRSLR
ncbi:flippase [Paraburkholderia sacchari]|uniref:flippase n=1 Tax=Paraburkholderia sacchari TaxID=159450 RepID=UPI000543773C|nr:flippase [Paraburkholderia sacchari]NLP61626.1 flippase [Paraburkholderia sacchari]